MQFNSTTKGKNKMQNYEGAESYHLSAEWQLYAAVVTASMSDKFYESTEDRIAALRTLIAQCQPMFAAQLAVYARECMNLRSIPLVVAVELARVHTGDALVSKLISKIVQRADEITELLAYYQNANQRTTTATTSTKKLNHLSKQVQKGLQLAFNKFDEYQFAKYNRSTEIKLKDALFLVHPKAKSHEQQLLFNKIAANTLEIPYTWETELSALGQNKYDNVEAKKLAFQQKWEELLDSNKVGYMALLRNLRNILQAEVSIAHIKKVCATLSSTENVLRSKQLPFRFLAAYRELQNVPSGFSSTIMDALEQAVQVSAANIAGFPATTNVVVACDVSGSMQHSISARSTIMNYDIGLLLGMLLKSRCANVVSGIFGDTWKVVNLPSSSILANVDAFYKREGEVGYSTNGYLVLQDLIDKKYIAHKIMIFTDCQLWDSRGKSSMNKLWNTYKTISPTAKLYLFDLSGYGSSPLDIAQENVYLIAGWSDKVFDILAAIDGGSDALKEIKQIMI